MSLMKRILLGSEDNSSSKSSHKGASSSKREKSLCLNFFHEFEVPLSRFESCGFDEFILGPRFICCHRNLGLEMEVGVYPKGLISKSGRHVHDYFGFIMRYRGGPWNKVDAGFQVYFILPDCKRSFPDSVKKPVHGVMELCGERIGYLFHKNSVNQLRAHGVISERQTIRFGSTVSIPGKYFDWELCHQEQESVAQEHSRIFFRGGTMSSGKSLFSTKECFFGPLFNGASGRNSTPPEGSDFLITVGDSDIVFHCHRFVLQQKIPEFFNGMMDAGMEEAKKGTLDLHAFRSESVENVLYFIYNNEISEEFSKNDPEVLDEVLHLSEMLHLPKLKSECGKQMLEGIVDENLERIIDTADKFHMEEVMKKCLLLRTKQISKENAVDLLIRSDKLKLEPIRNVSMNFVAENLQKLREELSQAESTVLLLEEIMVLCEKRMLAQKQFSA